VVRLLLAVVVLSGCGGDKTPERTDDVVTYVKDVITVSKEVESKDIAPIELDIAEAADIADTDNEIVDVDDAGQPADGQPVEPAMYPLDDVLRINHIQAKGTHNSYHLQPLPVTIPDWDYNHAKLSVQLQDQGVRQIELDIHKNDKGGFDVFHVPFVDPKSVCDTLRSCLTEVKAWSDDHPGHHVLFILIEPKDAIDLVKIDDYNAVDAAILEVWPEDRLVRPDDVRGEHPTLRDALETDGWPTLGASRNKAMFVMLDGGDHRKNYLKTFPNLEGAVIFMRGGEKEPWACCLEYNNPVDGAKTINEFSKKGYLVRSDADDHGKSDEHNAKKAKAALSTGAHYISTDMPTKTEKSQHEFQVPGGSPSRCNPITAPPECTSKDIEALEN